MSWDQVWTSIKALLADLFSRGKRLYNRVVQAVEAALEASAEVFWAELAKAVAKLAGA